MTIHDLPTPVLLIDWPVAQRNIQTAAKLVAGTGAKLRPHFKSHKCLPIAKAQLAAGNCSGMTAATVAEAAALVEGGVADVLIANNVVVPQKVTQLVQLAKRATIRVAVNALENAQLLSAAAQRQGATVGVLVELSIGQLRWGLEPGPAVVTLAQQIAALPGLRFDGLQAYHGSGGHLPDAGARAEYSCTTMHAAVAMRQLIEARGLPCPIVSGTGTSTFAAVLGLAGLTELQIGTYALMDWTFQERTGNLFEIALTVLATVINATPDQFVLDVGMKGVSNRNGPARLPALTGYAVVPGFSEEHTLVRQPGHKVRVGDRLQLQPGHANGTINLYRQVVVHEGGEVRHIWPISATGYALLG